MQRRNTEPFQQITRLHSRLRRLLDRAFHEPTRPPRSSHWTPPADIYGTDEGVQIQMELPGVLRDAVSVSVQGNTVTIRGYREPQAAEEGEQYLQVERRFGRFGRSFRLRFPPASVDAGMEAGVLTVDARR